MPKISALSLVKTIGLATLLLILLAAGLLLPVRDWTGVLIEETRELGALGVAAFALTYLVAVLLLLPTWLLSIAAGIAFGFWALPLVAGTATVGAILAFLIARTLLRRSVAEWAKDRPLLSALNRVVATDGWKIVALLRLSPVVPFTLQNYFFGITDIPITQYALATFFGIIPGTALYVGIGLLGHIATTDSRLQISKIVLLSVGLLATFVAIAFVTRKTRAKLTEINNKHDGANGNGPITESAISVIIPTLNEQPNIEKTLLGLQPLRQIGAEVIVVDGGSADDTVALARPLADLVLDSARGRAVQMNTGARLAKGDVLLFLHADTALPEGAFDSVISTMREGDRVWGRFDVSIDSPNFLLRVVARLMNIRSRWTGIATGDQAIFVRGAAFVSVGGFPEIQLMEDIALSRSLKRLSPPACLRTRVKTSGRRWEQNRTLRTILLMWRLRAAYFFGADPVRLARTYGNERT